MKITTVVTENVVLNVYCLLSDYFYNKSIFSELKFKWTGLKLSLIPQLSHHPPTQPPNPTNKVDLKQKGRITIFW